MTKSGQMLVACSRMLARLELWSASLTVLYLTGNLDLLPEEAKGRIRYAFIMSGRRYWARASYVRFLKRDLDKSADSNVLLAAIAESLGLPRLAAAIYRRTARAAETSTEMELPDTLARFVEGIASGSTCDLLASSIEALCLNSGEDIVLVPVGSKYLQMYQLWLEQAHQHLPGTIVAMSLDPLSTKELKKTPSTFVLDLSPFFLRTDRPLHTILKTRIWMLRVLLLREFVRRGHRTFLIDLDAIAVSNVEDMIAGFPKVDVIVQRDRSIPMDVTRKLGFVLCCGFMVVSPTKASREFLEVYANRTLREMDDQFAINHLICEADVTEIIEETAYMTFRSHGVHWLCPDPSLVSRSLSSGKVVRHFHQLGQSTEELRHQLGLTKVDSVCESDLG